MFEQRVIKLEAARQCLAHRHSQCLECHARDAAQACALDQQGPVFRRDIPSIAPFFRRLVLHPAVGGDRVPGGPEGKDGSVIHESTVHYVPILVKASARLSGTNRPGGFGTLRPMTMKDRIRQLRAEKPYRSMREAAERIGIDYESYKKYETADDRGVPINEAEKIAQHYKVRVGWLICGEQPKHAIGDEEMELLRLYHDLDRDKRIMIIAAARSGSYTTKNQDDIQAFDAAD